MIHTIEIEGITLKTGDLICTTDGGGELLAGEFWRIVGKFIPGDVDHIIIYVGPGGRMIEAGANGSVIAFELPGTTWDADGLYSKRKFIDTFYGVSYPLERRALDEATERDVRERVAAYCEAQIGKPYNINFFNSETEESFYCSQLAYKAYKSCGMDLNTNVGVMNFLGTDRIVFPQELWSGLANRRARTGS